MTTTAPLTPLPPALLRVAQHLVEGTAPRDIASKMHLTPETVRHYLRQLREHLSCPPRSKPPVIVHALLTTRQLPPPTTGRPAPQLRPQEHRLLKAAAENSKADEIANASGIALAYVPSALNALLTKTRTRDVTQLIVLAHAWGLLNTARGTSAVTGTAR
ncbi:DNA-binding protein [Streptomyces sp. ISL-12]|uniref:DNA-binding protein n=1 Tax=Streptomyces sp. ISL-12 TaxID=2819177 RepID=UPI001BE61C38|nr:DNA-binding protein [Streptomyces sp. ISL-12]MBT2412069.1 DNA-binding protein [Streptomyces sp. ISL-12]